MNVYNVNNDITNYHSNFQVPNFNHYNKVRFNHGDSVYEIDHQRHVKTNGNLFSTHTDNFDHENRFRLLKEVDLSNEEIKNESYLAFNAVQKI